MMLVPLRLFMITAIYLLCSIQPSRAAAVAANRTVECCPNFPKAKIGTCPENEEFRCCGVCQQLSCVVPDYVLNCFICPSTCYCKEGYIRRELDAKCIPIQNCPKPDPESRSADIVSPFGSWGTVCH